MANQIFKNFDEVEENMRMFAPLIIYKYRSNWDDQYDRKFVTEQSAWFANPKNLNDPYDIRTPIKFDLAEVEHPTFLSKLKEGLKIVHPDLAFKEQELENLCESKLCEIKLDPKGYFERNYQDIRNGDSFDIVGVFSCASDGLNESMWAHYANNHSGFSVGFNTVDLARDFMVGCGPVKYSDSIPIHSFININSGDNFDSMYLKSKRWEYEKEFRFITLDIETESDRIRKYSISSVVEFILGNKFPTSKMNDFLSTTCNIFGKGIPVYKAMPKTSGYGFDRIKLN